MTVYTIASGVSSNGSGKSFSSGDVINVQSGGTVSSYVLTSGTSTQVASGGTASSDWVLSGGVETVASGGRAIGTTIDPGATMVLDSGAITAGIEVGGGGEIVFSGLAYSSGASFAFDTSTDVLTVSAGGKTQSVTLAGTYTSGQFALINTLGVETLSNTSVAPPYTVSSGQTSSGLSIDTTYINVLSGGIALAPKVSGHGALKVAGDVSGAVLNGGTMTVLAGGVATGTLASGAEIDVSGSFVSGTVSGSYVFVSAGGTVSGTSISDQTYVYLSSGASFVGGVVQGSTATVAAGAVVSGTIFTSSADIEQIGRLVSTTLDGSFAYVSSGATATGTLIIDRGAQYVANGAVVVSGTVSGNGSVVYVFAGGIAVSTTVDAGDSGEYVYAGGVASFTQVKSGGHQWVVGGNASGTVVSGGGFQVLTGGFFAGGAIGSSLITRVLSGGIEQVLAATSAISSVIASGGELQLMSGGAASGIELDGGAMVDFADLGFGAGGTVSFNAATDVLTVSEGGSSRSVNLNSPAYSGGQFVLITDGASGTLLRNTASGPPYVVSSGQVSSGLAIGFSSITVLSGGTAIAPVLSGGGTLYVAGTVSGGSLTSAALYTSTGGLVSQMSAAHSYIGVSAGTVISSTLDSTNLYVTSAGTASHDLIVDNGFMAVSSGGIVEFITISGPFSYDNIDTGGIAISNTVEAVGATYGEYVYSGGVTSFTQVKSGGAQYVVGGTASGTVVSGGGFQVLTGGIYASGAIGRSINTQVLSGGIEQVLATTSAISSVIASGGELQLMSGGAASGIELDGGAMVDFADLGFGVGGTVSFNATTNVLTVSEGGSSRSVNLNSPAYSGGQFVLITDGASGTMLSNTASGPPYVVSSGQVSSGLAIGFSSITVLSGGTAIAPVLSGGGTLYVAGTVSGGSLTSAALYTSTGGLVGQMSAAHSYIGVSAGTVISSTLDSTNLYVTSAGTASHDLIVDNGFMAVSSGGIVEFITISGPFSYDNIDTGGIAISNTVEAVGATYGEYVYSGGVTSFTQVKSGGAQYVVGGTASGTVISGGGFQYLTGGIYASGAISLAVSTTVLAGGTEVVSSGFVASATVVSSGGELDFMDGATVSDAVVMSGGGLLFESLTFSSGATATLDPTSHILTVHDGAVSSTLQLGASESYAGPITVTSGTGGVLVTLACFAEGTRIATTEGHVPVEQLKVGDKALLAKGGVRPIVWIGRRALDITRHVAPREVQPVRVAAHAFAPGQPMRDLYLSPDHAVFACGVLIAVKDLVNGAGIAQVPMGQIVYWHVELDAHDVILAEGLPVESFLENDNRHDFEGQAAMTLHPAMAGSPVARVVRQGEVLEGIRAMLAAVPLQRGEVRG